MGKKSFNRVEDFLEYEEENGFEKFEKKKRKARFDDEIGHRRERKKTIKDLKVS